MKLYEIANYLRLIVLGSDRYIKRQNKFFIISATLDKRNRIISIGENSSIKTHPMMLHYSTKSKRANKIYLHAEISAMVKSQRLVHKLIVIRIDHNGQFALAKPCPLCQMALSDAKITKVYYTTNERSLERL
jgi:deoxycytidylate deaminase